MLIVKLFYWITDYYFYYKGKFFSHAKNYNLFGTKNITLVFIPGITLNWKFYTPLMDYMANQGYGIMTLPEIGNNMESISKTSEITSKLIDKSGLRKIILIGHSKGGLIGKHILIHHNNEKNILGLISLATPFSGAIIARIIPFKSYKELSPGSELIKNLQENKQINKQIISIEPKYDDTIWDETCYLENALDNIKTETKGHNRIIWDKEVYKIILESIKKIAK